MEYIAFGVFPCRIVGYLNSVSGRVIEREFYMGVAIDRRSFLKHVGGAVAAGLAAGVACGGSTSRRKPNIVFVLVDDLGWADLGCYGSELHETPNIDRLARESMRFTDAYAAAPVCSPTRASIMTGKYPARLHMTIWYESSGNPPRGRKLLPPVTQGNMPHEQVTIAEVLKEAGYFTAHVGKWHLGDASHYPETQGFDVNIGGTFWGAPASFFSPYKGAKKNRWGGEYRYVPGVGDGPEGEYLTDRLTDEALKIMEGAKDGPFFLNLWYHTVHTPIEGKPRLVEYYNKKIRAGMSHQNAGYAAMVHSLDENVGRLVSKIDELGIADNTILIFFSDNGGFINKYDGKPVTNNSPLRSGKGSLYEGGIREPLIVRWPGVTKAGSVCMHPVCSTDFYRTILEMTGLDGDSTHNTDVDGLSLVPLLKEPDADLGRDTLYWHYPHYYQTTTPVSAIRRGKWKLLEYFEDGHVELYDLDSDIGENVNLSEKMPGRAAELRRELDEWRKQVDAQLPVANSERTS